MIFRVKFQSMYFYLFFLDGQLQPFTTVTHAKESSHNSSGSGVEVACHGLADIITDCPISSSRMAAQKGEDEKQIENLIEPGKITEIESGEDELGSIRIIEDSKNETIKNNETTGTIHDIETNETTKDEVEEPFESIETIMTTDNSKNMETNETFKTESPTLESFETIQPDNEKEPIKELVETIGKIKPTKSVAIIETVKADKPEVTKIIDITNDTIDRNYRPFMSDEGVKFILKSKFYDDFLKENLESTIVVEVNDNICGFLVADKNWIALLMVDTDIHGYGAGSALLDVLQQNLRGQDSEIKCQIHSGNEKAIGFFESKGFSDAPMFLSILEGLQG